MTQSLTANMSFAQSNESRADDFTVRKLLANNYVCSQVVEANSECVAQGLSSVRLDEKNERKKAYQ